MRKFLSFTLVALLLLTGWFMWITQGDVPESIQSSAGETTSGEAMIGGDFSLVDQRGEQVRDHDFRGKIMLVFFGFTHCPDICPVSVASLSRVMELLGKNADQVAPVFITVDPARDTPEVMKAYLANFDSRMVGLTGGDEQIKQVAAAYKAFYSVADEHAGHGDHAVDHSGFIYLMDKNGKYVRHFSYDAPAEDMAKAVSEALNP